MRISILTVILVAGSLVGGSPTTVQASASGTVRLADTAPSGFVVFTSKAQRYQIAYPNTWFARQTATAEYFFGEAAHRFPTIVNVSTTKDRGGSLEQLTTRLRAQLVRVGARIDRIESMHVGGLPASLIVARFTGKAKLHDRFETALFKARGKVWEITLTSHPSIMGLNITKFNTMLASFKLL